MTHVEVVKKQSPACIISKMGSAIGFAAVVIVMGVLMPEVLHSLQTFLLAFLAKATLLLQQIPVSP